MTQLESRSSEPRAMTPIVAERYRLLAELGRGGMAQVYLAATESRGDGFTKLVVIKQLLERVARDDEFVTMFLDEARVAARLNHPHVVQTIDSGRSGSELFIAMEYLDGQPLNRILSRAAAANEGYALATHLAVLSDVLSGLHYAHTLADFDGSPLNIVHRDVTPQNVFVTYDGQVKVLDFGIAHAEGRSSRTRYGVIKGKIAYMAPEQARMEQVDARTDVFAAGVILFEFLSKSRLWLDASDKDILRCLIRGNVPASPRERVRALRPSAADADVPAALDAICRRALAPAPADRYPTALAFQQELDTFLASIGRPTAQAMGAEVARLFADRRALTRRLIEEQLSAVCSPRRPLATLAESQPDDVHDAMTLPVPVEPTRVSAPDVALMKVARGDKADALEQPSTGTPIAPATAPPSTQTPRAGAPKWILAGAALAVLGFAFATLRLAERRSNARDVPRVHVVLRASPPDARFRIDDGPDLPNPYVGDIARDPNEHVVAISANGCSAKQERVTFSDDVSLRVVLAER